ncbi:hypothetical protein OPV22_001797 [Ensete ventricosum]|uniref:Uncharacterized protein n=1 Tax=Ensete ventricosum TaxID=4639 RepID=A0AAV8RWG3_ENSVE|nr:hypothetical protein OPV22_001797 [Ensete ventricosum]
MRNIKHSFVSEDTHQTILQRKDKSFKQHEKSLHTGKIVREQREGIIWSSRRSPLAKSSKSFFNAQTSIIFSYFSLSKGTPKTMFSLTFPDSIHGDCETYALLPLTFTLPPSFGISPRMHDNRLDFPEPTVPQIATFIPLCTFNCIFSSVGHPESWFQLNVPRSISTSTFASFLGIISTASALISSSSSIPNVANADKTLPAVRGIPMIIHVPNVTTDMNIGLLTYEGNIACHYHCCCC